ncbi:zinc transporter ZIP11-like isoform X1, partial [Lates japonicus]
MFIHSPEIVINSSLAHAPPERSPSSSAVMLFPSGNNSGTMLEGYSPVTQALLGTLFTWGLTAAGAALVFVFSSRQ